MATDTIQISITANSAKALLMLATQQIDLLTTDNIRLKHRVQELTDQCNEINNKLHEKEQHLNVGPSYEEMENALLTEQEYNGNLTKEVDRLTAILKERDAEIEHLKTTPPIREVVPIVMEFFNDLCFTNEGTVFYHSDEDREECMKDILAKVYEELKQKEIIPDNSH